MCLSGSHLWRRLSHGLSALSSRKDTCLPRSHKWEADMRLYCSPLGLSLHSQLPHLCSTPPNPSVSLSLLVPSPSCPSSLERVSLALLQSILPWLASAPSSLPAGGLFEDQTPHVTHGELRRSQGAPGRRSDEAETRGAQSPFSNSAGAALSRELCGPLNCSLVVKISDATSRHSLLFSSPGHLSPFTLPTSIFCSFPQWRPLLTLPHPVDSPWLGLALKPSHSLQSFPGLVEKHLNLISICPLEAVLSKWLLLVSGNQLPFVLTFYSLRQYFLFWACVHFPIFILGCKHLSYGNVLCDALYVMPYRIWHLLRTMTLQVMDFVSQMRVSLPYVWIQMGGERSGTVLHAAVL